MTPDRPVTATDVARRAGVSQATVSLVLSHNPRARVAEATRARVVRIAEELGYRPNVVAQSLVSRRSFALGLLVPDLSNPFYASVASGAERVAAEEGYALMLAETVEVPAARHLEAWRARQIDGVILDALGARALRDVPGMAQMNVVMVDEPSANFPGVASDALSAGRQMAEHLLGLGHRRVAILGPATDVHGVRQRERGVVQALREAGIVLASNRLLRVPPTAAGGEAGMRTLLASAERPTAVACLNDLIAVGALKAAARAGVAVPRELSIIGCDDLELARLVTPELTTIAVPARELGARAARLLVRRLAGQGTPASTRLLPVRLVVRGTTAAPDGAA
jgi:DNA-binding LacI/PurR family transcriptional regulator